jgi:hypothetical protein
LNSDYSQFEMSLLAAVEEEMGMLGEGLEGLPAGVGRAS